MIQVSTSTNTQLQTEVSGHRNEPTAECNERWLRLYQKANTLPEYRRCRKIQTSAGKIKVIYSPSCYVLQRKLNAIENICTSTGKILHKVISVCLTQGSKRVKNLSPQLTQSGSYNSKDIRQGLSIFCYLGYCIYPSAGRLRELLLEIYNGWPGFIHGQM